MDLRTPIPACLLYKKNPCASLHQHQRPSLLRKSVGVIFVLLISHAFSLEKNPCIFHRWHLPNAEKQLWNKLKRNLFFMNSGFLARFSWMEISRRLENPWMSVATEVGFLPEIMVATSAGLHGFLWHSFIDFPNHVSLLMIIYIYIYIYIYHIYIYHICMRRFFYLLPNNN